MRSDKPSKFKSRTSWRVKLEKPQQAKVVTIPASMQKQLGAGTMVIPRPLEVDDLIRQVPRGRLVTVRQLRERLARDHHADVACPLTTGIFIRIAAEAAEEDRAAGRSRLTPYWRVLGEGGRLNPKFPGGVTRQAARLRQEGHHLDLAAPRKQARVKEFDHQLVKW